MGNDSDDIQSIWKEKRQMTQKKNTALNPWHQENKVKDYLRIISNELKKYPARNYDHQAFIGSAIMAIADNPKLVQCMESQKGQISLYNALKYAAYTGLSLNPQEGKACLVPYRKKEGNEWFTVVNYQIMKNGLIEIALDSGKIETMPPPEVVRENDTFEMERTAAGDSYRFIPALKNRGDIMGFFASVRMKDGTQYIKYMSNEDILEHREKYARYWKDDHGDPDPNAPWVKSYIGQAIKTVQKALFRYLHLSAAFDQAIGADDDILRVDKTLALPVSEPEKPKKLEAGQTSEDVTQQLKTSKTPPPQDDVPDPEEPEEQMDDII